MLIKTLEEVLEYLKTELEAVETYHKEVTEDLEKRVTPMLEKRRTAVAEVEKHLKELIEGIEGKKEDRQ